MQSTRDAVMKQRPFVVGDVVEIKGKLAEVIDYSNKKKVTLRFMATGYITVTCSEHIRAGNVKDPLSPTVYGAGVLGVEFNSQNEDMVRKRILWQGVIRRVHDPKFLARNPAYSDVTISAEMLYFTDFYRWCCSQKGSTEDGWQLDKDILIKGNREYSFDKCCFVPQSVNKLLTTAKVVRGDTPLGVYITDSGRYKSLITKGGKAIHLGVYDTIEEAFLVYKREKEGIIRTEADKWKDRLDDKVYNALINWQVDISD